MDLSIPSEINFDHSIKWCLQGFSSVKSLFVSLLKKKKKYLLERNFEMIQVKCKSLSPV